MPSIENQTLSKLYYSIGEVAEMLQVNASLLRFWEKEFNLAVSKKNKKGNRLLIAGKHPNKVKVACAREMVGFVWESLNEVAA